ncbi:MAG: DUF1015 family protein [Acidimicrobiales bacterium]|jgi:uncharacterized protein (DUF1015 family)|nr:DUF1015 family protein [Acidimicrobiales bacterium]
MTERLFEPFQGWLIQPDWASSVIAGAYDGKTPAERRAIVEANPYSYFGVTRSREDLASGEVADDDELLRRGAETLTRILDAGAFEPTAHAALYVYRLVYGHHVQTGVVGALDIDGLRDGRVLTHENVRPERATLLGRHLEVVGASSSPIALTHPPDEAVRAILATATERSPHVDHVIEDVQHLIWPLDADDSDAVADHLAGGHVYVTDGHHRSAAALAGRDAHPNDPAYARTLGVLFPADELRVEAFHRRAADVDLRATDDFRASLATVGIVTASSDEAGAMPTARGEVGVYHHGEWTKLVLDPLERPSALASLDVERLRRDVLGHVLGIDELAPDSGVDYVPGPAGIAEVVARCDADDLLGFVVHPTDIDDLMEVAAEGELMPPKSSYFAPKPRSGVFLRVLGTGATAHLPTS